MSEAIIQYQDLTGNWITCEVVPNQPPLILQGMQRAADYYQDRRITTNALIRLRRDMDNVQRRARHQVETDTRPASGLRLPHHRSERRGRADPFEGHAGDPDDR